MILPFLVKQIKHGDHCKQCTDPDPDIDHGISDHCDCLRKRIRIHLVDQRPLVLQIRVHHISKDNHLRNGFEKIHYLILGKESFHACYRIKLIKLRLQRFCRHLPFNLKDNCNDRHNKSNDHDRKCRHNNIPERSTDNCSGGVKSKRFTRIITDKTDCLSEACHKPVADKSDKDLKHKEKCEKRCCGNHLGTSHNLSLLAGILQLFGCRFFCFLAILSFLRKQLQIIGQIIMIFTCFLLHK